MCVVRETGVDMIELWGIQVSKRVNGIDRDAEELGRSEMG